VIRYDIDRTALLADIAAIDPRWSAKVARRTARFVRAGRYEEGSSLWAPVKPVYMDVQKSKCIFCERRFENKQYGKIEFDLEHFRPKSSVVALPNEQFHPNLNYDFETGMAADVGYYWLAYEIENYAASCKVCNSALKSNYFPVAGRRGAAIADVRSLASELPFLCYPLGTSDEDPEELITFVATTAIPKAESGYRRQRGQIIIDFFDLNGREELHQQRAEMISLFGGALLAISAGTANETDIAVADSIFYPTWPHAACIRAFRRLWQENAAEAAMVYDKCRRYAIAQTASAPPHFSRLRAFPLQPDAFGVVGSPTS
jgi:hypothetical protein